MNKGPWYAADAKQSLDQRAELYGRVGLVYDLLYVGLSEGGTG